MKSKYGKSVFEINVLKTISQMQNLCYVFKHIKIKKLYISIKNDSQSHKNTHTSKPLEARKGLSSHPYPSTLIFTPSYPPFPTQSRFLNVWSSTPLWSVEAFSVVSVARIKLGSNSCFSPSHHAVLLHCCTDGFVFFFTVKVSIPTTTDVSNLIFCWKYEHIIQCLYITISWSCIKVKSSYYLQMCIPIFLALAEIN